MLVLCARVQQQAGGSAATVGVPKIIMLTLCDSIGEPFQYHVEFLSLQPMF